MQTFNPVYLNLIVTSVVALVTLTGPKPSVVPESPISPGFNSIPVKVAPGLKSPGEYTPLQRSRNSLEPLNLRGYPFNQMGDFGSTIKPAAQKSLFSMAYQSASAFNS